MALEKIRESCVVAVEAINTARVEAFAADTTKIDQVTFLKPGVRFVCWT